MYPMQLQGPRSAEIMVDVFGEEILDLRYYWWMRSSVDGIDVVISYRLQLRTRLRGVSPRRSAVANSGRS